MSSSRHPTGTWVGSMGKETRLVRQETEAPPGLVTGGGVEPPSSASPTHDVSRTDLHV